MAKETTTTTKTKQGPTSAMDELARELRLIHHESWISLKERTRRKTWKLAALHRRGETNKVNGNASPAHGLRSTTLYDSIDTAIDFLVQYSRWLFQTWGRVSLTTLTLSLFTRPFDLFVLYLWASVATLLLTLLLVLDILIIVFPTTVGSVFDVATDYLIAGRQMESLKRGEKHRVLWANFPAEVRQAAFLSLSAPPTAQSSSNFPEGDEGNTHVVDLDVSKLLLALSALIYTRRRKAVSESLLLVSPPPSDPTLDPDATISETASACFAGLHYQPICELGHGRSSTSPGAPVAGLFYHPSHPNFIVLAFKGTSPAAFSEWVVDFDYRWIDASRYLGPGYGQVHRGFYESFFPTGNGKEDAYQNGVTPYELIRRAIVATAGTLRRLNGEREVNVYVTGHSLGAALASMWYARAVQRPDDFANASSGSSAGQALAVIRDLYVFGAPIFGDVHAVNSFNYRLNEDDPGELSSQSTPRPQSSSTPPARNLRREAWRLVSHRDAIGTLIPSLGDDAGGATDVDAALSASNSFNYAHVGQEIQLRASPQLSYTGPGTALVRGTPVRIVSSAVGTAAPWRLDVPRLLVKAQSVVPVLGRLLAHAPLLYAQGLNRVKTNAGSGRVGDDEQALPYADFKFLQ